MAMWRLLASQAFHEVFRCSHCVASRVTGGKLTRSLQAFKQGLPNAARHLCTGRPASKDAVLPKAHPSEKTETIDLDMWKSVMRSKAATEEKQEVNDKHNQSDEESPQEPEPTDDSSLEATRVLVTMWRLAGKQVPREITDEQLQEMSLLTTKSARKKFLKFLYIKEAHKKRDKEKQQARKEVREEALAQKRAQVPDGEFMKNSLFLQVWDRSLDKVLAWRCAQAMVFGQPLVFDMSYESHMSKRELENTVSQLMEVEGYNRRATEPYHLHYCNVRPGSAYEKELVKRYGAEVWERLLVTSTHRHYVDLFPKEDLVYLTADSPNILRAFDHSKVYIVGAFVDRSVRSGLSLANAKRLKLATARLPLDTFLDWEMGAKNLTLDQMMRIMLTVKDSGKWEDALKFVPTRKHDGFRKHGGFRKQQGTFPNRATDPRAEENSGRPLWSARRNTERTFPNVDKSLYRPQRELRFSGQTDRRDGNAASSWGGERKPAVSSFPIKREGKKNAGKGKMFWKDNNE